MQDKSFGDILKTTIKYTVGIGMGMDFGQCFLKMIRKAEIKACNTLISKLDKYTKKEEQETDISEEKSEES